MDFNTANVEKLFADLAKQGTEAADRTIRGTALDLFSGIVMLTPVGDPDLWQSPAPKGYVGGRLRGEWQIGIDRQPQGELDIYDDDGAGTIKAGDRVLDGFSLLRHSDIWFYNPMPYAERVENGWSTQAPQGMVGRTLELLNKALEENARDNKL